MKQAIEAWLTAIIIIPGAARNAARTPESPAPETAPAPTLDLAETSLEELMKIEVASGHSASKFLQKVTEGGEYRDNFRQNLINYDLEPFSRDLDNRRESKNLGVHLQDQYAAYEQVSVCRMGAISG